MEGPVKRAFQSSSEKTKPSLFSGAGLTFDLGGTDVVADMV
jgi:hypothetical protein